MSSRVSARAAAAEVWVSGYNHYLKIPKQSILLLLRTLNFHFHKLELLCFASGHNAKWVSLRPVFLSAEGKNWFDFLSRRWGGEKKRDGKSSNSHFMHQILPRRRGSSCTRRCQFLVSQAADAVQEMHTKTFNKTIIRAFMRRTCNVSGIFVCLRRFFPLELRLEKQKKSN